MDYMCIVAHNGLHLTSFAKWYTVTWLPNKFEFVSQRPARFILEGEYLLYSASISIIHCKRCP